MSSLYRFPLIVSEPLTVEAQSVTTEGAGVVSSMGILGRNALGVSCLLVPYETAIEEWSLMGLSRQVIDQTLFARFAADLERQTGSRHYSDVRAGADPPDVAARRDGTNVGVELTQFANPSRRGAVTRLKRLERAIDARGKANPRLEGWHILVFVDDLTAPDFRAEDVDEIAALIATMDPAEHAAAVEGETLPEQLQVPPPLTTARGVRMVPAPPGGLASTTRFQSRHGFELGLAYSTYLDRKAELARLRRLIGQKDVAGNDELVITFGAPDHTGLRWPAESLVFGWLMREPLEASPARYLAKAYLYNWYGDIVELPLGQ